MNYQLLADVLTIMVPLIVPPLSALIGAVLWKLYTKFSNEATAQDRANMEGEINAAIGAGAAVIPLVVRDSGNHAAIKADLVSAAADYMTARFPDRAGKIAAAAGAITPLSQKAAVSQTIEARLNNGMVSTTLTQPAQGVPQPLRPLTAPTLAARP